jgi:hypothetical protein
MRSSRGAKGTAKPPEDVPERYDHGKNLVRQSPSELVSNSLILRVYDVLMNDRGIRDRDTKNPKKLGEATQILYVNVKDADEHLARAKKAGVAASGTRVGCRVNEMEVAIG